MATRAKSRALRVFMAHSFERKPPPWSSVSDSDVALFFEQLMKSLGWAVLTGKRSQARPIGEKVAEAVNDSKGAVGIFTGKHEVGAVRLPSAWVLCECSYALGRFEGSPYLVAGFREKEVDPKELAMLTIGGMEFPEFERDTLSENKPQFAGYLRDLESRILYGASGQMAMLPAGLPYKQIRLHKIYLVYRNGYATVHNINEIVIHDPDRFESENKGRVRHHIWNQTQDFPPLDSMLQTPIHRRKQEPFFLAKIDYHKRKKLNIPLPVTMERHEGKDITFSVCFMDEEGEPLRLKAHDSIRYQYAWGLPDMYPVVEEGLSRVEGDEISAREYCFAQAEANHGTIEHFTLELRFEKEATGSAINELFSVSPFYQTARTFAKDADWSTSRRLPLAKDEPAEFDFWYEVYGLDLPKFDGRIRALWRPASANHRR